ncbi:MAG TPA: alpha/beta hydrolase [Acidimicrobiales bacterium]
MGETDGVRTRTAHVNGVDLEVTEAGEPGSPLVILSHGFPEGAYSWRHQVRPLVEAGYHVIVPDQRGYGRSSAPRDITAYGIRELTGDLLALADEAGAEKAVYVGHDWGAAIVWALALMHPERVRAVVGASVGFPQVAPMRPIELMKIMFGDRFFYMLYFQQVGPPEEEAEADTYRTMKKWLWGASGDNESEPPAELPPLEGTRIMDLLPDPPAELPAWLTEADIRHYADQFAISGFFGPLSYYRNIDANWEVTKDLPADRLTMPSYFITGERDGVRRMDPEAIERMTGTLPGFQGATIIPGAGHWVQQEAPQEFNDALLGFLGTIDG